MSSHSIFPVIPSFQWTLDFFCVSSRWGGKIGIVFRLLWTFVFVLCFLTYIFTFYKENPASTPIGAFFLLGAVLPWTGHSAMKKLHSLEMSLSLDIAFPVRLGRAKPVPMGNQKFALFFSAVMGIGVPLVNAISPVLSRKSETVDPWFFIRSPAGVLYTILFFFILPYMIFLFHIPFVYTRTVSACMRGLARLVAQHGQEGEAEQPGRLVSLPGRKITPADTDATLEPTLPEMLAHFAYLRTVLHTVHQAFSTHVNFCVLFTSLSSLLLLLAYLTVSPNLDYRPFFLVWSIVLAVVSIFFLAEINRSSEAGATFLEVLSRHKGLLSADEEIRSQASFLIITHGHADCFRIAGIRISSGNIASITYGLVAVYTTLLLRGGLTLGG
jgi:hypothetical protein